MSFFASGKYPVMIATDYGGRGFDFSKVEHIINLDFPENAQLYLHRYFRSIVLSD